MRGWARSLAMMATMTGLATLGLAGCGEAEPTTGDEPVSTETVSVDEGTVVDHGETDADAGASEVDGDGLWVPTKITVSTDGKQECVASFSYDEHGNCTKFAYDSTDDDGDATWEKQYDENGYVSEEKCSFTNMPPLGFSVTMDNRFDEEGRLARTLQKDVTGGESDIWIAYEYDSDGNLSKVTDSEGDETSYDEHGNVTSVSSVNPYVKQSNDSTSRYEYAYDENGIASEATEMVVDQTDEDGKPMPDETHKISYERDENGNITKKTLVLSDESVTTFEVEYKHIEHPSIGARLYSHYQSDFHRFYY